MPLSPYLMQEYIFFMDPNKFKWILNDLSYIKKILILKLMIIIICPKGIKRNINDNKEASKIGDIKVRKDIEIEIIKGQDKIEGQEKIERQDKKGDLDKIDHRENKDLNKIECLGNIEGQGRLEGLGKIEGLKKIEDPEKIGGLDRIDRIDYQKEIIEI